MKKLLVIFGLALAMFACNGNSTKAVEEAIDSDTIVVVDSIDSTLIDTINVDLD